MTCQHPWEQVSISVGNRIVSPAGEVLLPNVAWCSCGEKWSLDDPLLRAAAYAYMDGKLVEAKAESGL